MSFIFPTWTFPPSFHEAAKEMLEGALNKGSKPPIISGRISVTELNMGKDPPTLTLLEIGDLSMERFRGIFRLSYQGDAWLEVRCRVQANPLSHNPHLAAHATLPLNAPLIASQPLLVPMTLRLSSLNLRAILILVVSKSKGITLVFKNDPLQNVDVSSTFDSVEVIRGYLQKEIEGQLREMFREDLPVIIHRLSQQWFAGTGVGGRVEMPYREEQAPLENTSDDEEPAPEPINSFGTSPARPVQPLRESDPAYPSPSSRRRTSRTVSERKSFSSSSTTAIDDSPTSYSSFPEMERYDPTYGMRPEGLPSHSGYEAFGKLFDKSKEGKRKGLGALMDLAEEVGSIGGGATEDGIDDGSDDEGDYADPGDESEGSEDDDDARSLDLVEGNRALRTRPRLIPDTRGSSRSIASTTRNSRHRHNHNRRNSNVEFETISMAGGSTISRPRIFHVQSQIRAPSEAGYAGSVVYNTSGTMANGTAGSVTARASSVRSSDAGSQSGTRATRSNVAPTEVGRTRASSRLSLDPTLGMSPRPALSRQHSRAESVPAFSFADQSTGPQRNMLAMAAMNNSTRANGTGTEGHRPPGLSRASSMYQRQDTTTKPPALAQHPSAKFITPPRPRRSSLSQQVGLSGSPPAWPSGGSKSKSNQIVVPMNDSVSQLATLYHSNHTLSPYARGHEHIAVRSFPHLSRASSTYSAPINSQGVFLSGNAQSSMGYPNGGHPAAKGQRKRIYRMNTSGPPDDGSGSSRRESIEESVGSLDGSGLSRAKRASV